MITTAGLTKIYKTTAALSDLDLEVRKGEVFGLLGPNGSGKTTTIRLLLGMLKPTLGTSKVGGFDSWRQSVEVRRLVSYLPGELRLFGSMTAYGFLKYLSSLRGGDGLDRAVAIADRIMKLDLRRKIRTFSTGMKQKLALSQAFADPVEILILDEPTSALDPSARNDVLGLVMEAKRQGQTVIFSGHVLSEVERVADRVAIMRKGRLMHLEDMHERRRNNRLIKIRYGPNAPTYYPDELELSVREQEAPDVFLLEHRGQLGALLAWLPTQDVLDIAIGTEDLTTLYDRYHGPNAPDDLEPALS